MVLFTVLSIAMCFILVLSDNSVKCKGGLTESIETALLNQMKNEYRNSYFYLSATYFFTERHFDGISAYFKREHQNEVEHALSIGSYMTVRGTDLTTKCIDVQMDIGNLQSVKEEILKWKEPLDVFQFFFEAEQQNQMNLNDLMTLTLYENDHGAYQFLSELIKAQIQETHEAEGILAKAISYSKFSELLWHLDEQLK